MQLEYEEVPGDGNCQYSAISTALKRGNAAQLRQLTAKHIAKNPQRYGGLLQAEDETVEAYAEKTAKDRTWGDHITLEAAAQVMKTNIWVLREEGIQRAARPEDAVSTIIIAYEPYHYDAIHAPRCVTRWLEGTAKTRVGIEELRVVAKRGAKKESTGQTSDQHQRGNSPGPERWGVLDTRTGASRRRDILHEKSGNPTAKVLDCRGERIGSTKRSEHEQEQRTLHLTSVNVASLRNRLDDVMKLDTDVICLQETALTAAGQGETAHAMKGMCGKNRYRPMWGDPQPGRKKEGLTSIDIAQRGGLATFVREPRTVLGSSLDRDDATPEMNRRWQHTRVSVDGKNLWLHIITVYCPAGEAEEKRRQREQLLHHILQKKVRELGNVPIVVAGDLNTDEGRSQELRYALHTGWTDAAAACAMQRGEEPGPTFVRDNCASRIDYILLNPIAAQALKGCETRKDVKGADHMTLTVEMDLGRPVQAEYPKIHDTEGNPGTAAEADGRGRRTGA
eukprot:TRINITY_DN16624_c0_g1_i5.p1 TRINITY_DN16624_c0_g1~~TRINITY_DN16624_c0_g1_i5.p1  ORF type:complete len:507 (+),score=72.11 TRINITY_DN16624_c0_g1_i5:1078-2598(+)